MARVAVVTGGTRGIGEAISKALKAAGYKVAANYGGNDAAATKFKAETGIPVFKWDVASDIRRAAPRLEQVEAEVGPVDVLVNNAGITRDTMFHRMTAEQWGAVINTNLEFVVQHVPAGDRRHAQPKVRPHHQHLLDQRAEGPDGAGRTILPPRQASWDLPRRWRRKVRAAELP